MKLSEIGEFGLIDRLTEMASSLRDDRKTAWQRLVTGIGDDAAVWQAEAGSQLATIDAMTEGIHFTRQTLSWEDLGWKSLAVNLSDIAAMGGQPGYALVSLGLPGEIEIEDVAAIYRGMLALAETAGTVIAGGDTCRAPVVSVTIAVWGTAGDSGVLSRAAARPGDLIAVTGYPGTAAAGLEMLSAGMESDRETRDLLRQAFTRPVPRLTEGQKLLAGGVRAAIDISDGLLADLGHICRRSQVSARVELMKLPVHPLVRSGFGDHARELALAGGEDYELLFTAGDNIMQQITGQLEVPVAIIGRITGGNPGQITLLDERGEPVVPSRTGWEHFISKEEGH